MPLAFALLLAPLAAPPQDLLVETRRMLPLLEGAGADLRQALSGDVTGDGWPDVLLVGDLHDVLLRSSGHGLLEGVDVLPSGTETTATAVLADLDGDGMLDAFLMRTYAASPVFVNQGGALVHGYDVVGASAQTVRAEAGDVDLDGDVDVVLAAPLTSDELLRNTGGVLAPDAAALVTPSDSTTDVGIGDLDGDGDLDLAFSVHAPTPFTGERDRVHLNDGSGAFAQLAGPNLGADGFDVELADADGDGDLDACVPMQWALTPWTLIAKNDGTAHFDPQTVYVGPVAGGSRLRDFDGDGLLDALTFGASAGLHLGTPGGGFVDAPAGSLPPTPAAPYVLAADLDGDLDVDALVLTGSNPPLLWLNDGGGAFSEVQTAIPYETNAKVDVAVGDVDGDGSPDLYVAEAQGPNKLYRNDGTGQWTGAALPASSSSSRAVALGDLDGDGDVDLLSGASGPAVQLLNDGAGGLSEHAGAMPPGSAHAAVFALGDLDGDADPDVVVVRSDLQSGVHVLANDGAATFAETASMPTGVLEQLATPRLFDADADGDLDLLLASSDATRFYLGDGAGGLAESPAGVPSTSSRAIAVADVDADGDVDAFVARSGVDELWRNAGGAFQADPAFTAPFEDTSTAALGDLDGDGDADLVESTASGDRVLANDGTGAFALASGFAAGFLVDVELADLDGDGDLDAAAADTLRALTLTNVGGGQVAWRSVPRAGKTLAIDVFGAAGAPWFLAASPNAAELPLAPFGTLKLDPTVLWPIASGAMPAAGLARIDVPVPAGPSLVGQAVQWQALTGATLAFTNREATLVTSL